jgi:hypothetical protein
VTFNRLFGLVTIAVVAAGVVLAFLFLGTPAHQRQVSLDEHRARVLDGIASSINDRYRAQPLPPRLPEDILALDAANERGYEFHRVDATHYRLCTVFATNGSVEGAEIYVFGGPSSARVWRHGAGRTCYEFDVTVSPPMPRPTS